MFLLTCHFQNFNYFFLSILSLILHNKEKVDRIYGKLLRLLKKKNRKKKLLKVTKFIDYLLMCKKY